MSASENQTRANPRKELIDRQTQARVLELRLEQAQAELQQLQGLSLSSLLSGLSGQRAARIESAREACAELEQLHTEAVAAMTALQREVDSLQSDVDATIAQPRAEATVEPSTSTSATPAPAAPTPAMEHVERAMEACGQALRDLRDEMETLQMAGRCNLANGNRAIGAILGAGRRATAGQCAERVRASLRRFQAKLRDVLEDGAPEPELLTFEQDLDRAAFEFDGRWLGVEAAPDASAAWMEERLQLGDMLLERRLNTLRAAGG